MSTTRELITAALRKLNVVASNETPTDEDVEVALDTLNSLIDSRSDVLRNVHQIVPLSFLLTAGKFEYAVGPTGDWVTERPMRIEKVRFIMNPTVVGGQIVDTEGTIYLNVDMVNQYEFSEITLRGVTNAIPQKVLDQGGMPNRELQFWPVPSSSTQGIELWCWEPLANLTLDQQLNLPPGYERYLTYSLALECADIFGKEETPELILSFGEAEASLQTLNQVAYVATPSPGALNLQARNRVYNIIDFYQGSWMLGTKVN